MNQANQIFAFLKESPEFYKNVETILQHSKNDNTKFFALQSFEAFVKVNKQ